MVSTRSKAAPPSSPQTGDKRSPTTAKEEGGSSAKKAKKQQDLTEKKEYEIAVQGEPTTETKKEENEQGEKGVKDNIKAETEAEAETDEAKTEKDDVKEAEARGDGDEDKVEDREDEVKREEKQESNVDADDEEPRHGTLESGHIYFLYRPKIEKDDAQSIDDISKFHVLLIPKSGPRGQSHYHRIIEVGKKKLPDPGAKHQVIWGLVGGIGSETSALKESFGAYTYETKTRGTRHQGAARPAARGHYILHSPRDELADSPDHNRQRDYKCILAYEITTPSHEDFGKVQEELGIEEKGALVIQVKDPDVQSNNNPRAAGIPRDKRAQYSKKLMDMFRGRRFIPANPPAFLDYQGAEILIITSPHELHDSLGKNGEDVEADMDKDAKSEKVDVDGALKELGLNKKDFDEEAMEGHWA
ncbi:uncharacterized protein IL334_002566 [Kwoniella shivajii]|uniref:Uncharacterized protein n=1 Tax=Kwoniella shivajii TaxID=564305 RepID=A0ABZ1CV29_9TREE|nr:hypothetical protein IL334_002566 [Kwoniella shivajii]